MNDRREDRGPWYLLTGLILGLALGLLYAWWLQPADSAGSSPASLRPEDKNSYRALIASAYEANGDLLRARARLELLGDQDLFRTLSQQAQNMLASGENPDEARALGLLAVAIGQGQNPAAGLQSTTPAIIVSRSGLTPVGTSPTEAVPPATQTRTPRAPTAAQETTGTLAAGSTGAPPAQETPVTTGDAGEAATETPPPRPTGTPRPTSTPSPTPGGPFVLTVREEACDPGQEPLLQIQAYDGSGQPVPGLEITVTWDGGEEHFFTGLKPELGLGYADFVLEPGITYTLRVAQAAQIIDDLQAISCQSNSGTQYWGGWRLRYEQR